MSEETESEKKLKRLKAQLQVELDAVNINPNSQGQKVNSNSKTDNKVEKSEPTVSKANTEQKTDKKVNDKKVPKNHFQTFSIKVRLWLIFVAIILTIATILDIANIMLYKDGANAFEYISFFITAIYIDWFFNQFRSYKLAKMKQEMKKNIHVDKGKLFDYKK